MRITILSSDATHPVNDILRKWIIAQSIDHEVNLVRNKFHLEGGDILFLISCTEVINRPYRDLYRSCLVLHASDLPMGKGWSPHIWELVNGADYVTLSLIEAEDKVDSGRIWKKIKIPIPKHSLWDEINQLIFTAEMQLMDYAVMNIDSVSPIRQDENEEGSYYPRRRPSDSKIDVFSSIAEQFDLIRVCDPKRYPAYFDFLGCRYTIKIEKV